MKDILDISVVVPVYGCAETLYELVNRLDECFRQHSLEYEVILVDDRSRDNAWDVIKHLSCENKKVKGIRFSNNFGQHYAISAGLEAANGNWCVVMDCDLQDPPEEIIKLYNKAQEGFDIVMAKRDVRKGSIFEKITSLLFHAVFNLLTDMKVDNRLASFGICSNKVVKNIIRYREKDRAFGYLTLLVGFARAEIVVRHAQRGSGKTSYNFSSRMHLALSHILSHSNKPLMLVIQLGFFLSSIGVMYGIWLIMRYLVWGQQIEGWTSVIVSLYLLVGLLILVIGVVGVYVGKIYSETKNRPLFIIDEVTNHRPVENIFSK